MEDFLVFLVWIGTGEDKVFLKRVNKGIYLNEGLLGKAFVRFSDLSDVPFRETNPTI